MNYFEATDAGKKHKGGDGPVPNNPITLVPVIGQKPHTGIFQGWPVRWTCCNGNLFRCPCDPSLFPEGSITEQASIGTGGSSQERPLTDEEKKAMAVAAAKRAMQLAQFGVVKSSAGIEEGDSNGWWKGTTLKQKEATNEGSTDDKLALPKGDWLCQSYHCDQAVNFKKNTKCYKCGAARRPGGKLSK